MSYNALRKGRYSQGWAQYLVTFVTLRRVAVFLDPAAAKAFVEELRLSGRGDEAHWNAWVLMPDHFHGLVTLGREASLATVVGRLKGRSARRINDHYGRRGPLWQPAFHDHALRREEDLCTMARYVVDNPVRAGLVPRRSEYPYWSCDWIAPEFDAGEEASG